MQSRNQRKQKLASDEKNKSTNLIVSQKQIQTNIFKLATKAKSNDPNFTQSYSKPKPNLITTEQMSSLITIEENLGSGNNYIFPLDRALVDPCSVPRRAAGDGGWQKLLLPRPFLTINLSMPRVNEAAGRIALFARQQRVNFFDEGESHRI